MRFYRFIAIACIIGWGNVALAQLASSSAGGSSAIVGEKNGGSWVFQSMGKGILKATFTPKGYTKAQQISDAIMVTPENAAIKSLSDAQKSIGAVTISDKGEFYSLSVGGSALVTQLMGYSSPAANGFSIGLAKDEAIFGGGERAVSLNRRGLSFDLYNRPSYGYGVGELNLNYSLPFFISNKGYGIFFDNPSKGHADIAKSDPSKMTVSFESGELVLYIIPGKSINEILKSYTSLIGTQPIPARWVFGNFMSRFGYRSDAQIRSIKAKMKAERIPMDAIIIDLFWFGDSIQNYVGNLDWVNRKAWPDPKKMIADFKSDSIKTVLITEPYVVKNTLSYDESVPFLAVDSLGKTYTLQNFYFGKGGLIDMFRNDAKDWFWSKYKKQMDIGVTGWWGDLGEPENHPVDVYHNLKDFGYSSRLYSANEVHNIYGHYWNKMLYTKFEKEYPDVRLFNLNRAGYANSARYIIFPWSGDVGRHWSGFRAQLPIMLTMSMSNVPYIHSDAGGFTFAERDNELYVRWLQMSSFSPILRPHGTDLDGLNANLPQYPSEPALFDDPYKSIVRRYIQLRYDLLPYNYTLGYQHMVNAQPLVRPLFFDSFNDSSAVKAEDQYLWGNDLLISPVLEKGAKARKLYLPSGSRWCSFFNPNRIFEGGQWIEEAVTLSDMPIFVREGAFIPMSPGLTNTMQYNPAKVEVAFFSSSKPSSYTMYDDDGQTNKSWEKRQYQLLKFSSNGKGTIVVEKDGGSYTGMPKNRAITFRIYNVAKGPQKVTVNGKAIQKSYDGASKQLVFNVVFSSKSLTIKLIN